ncbi:ABC transporter transmembrane protein [Streptomyces sp. CBMAI 2042]|uniref:hypothetical protein n=1 Tax=Streptomyces sp. CBMAI 2042 TaxID=2305222 RepID=UPI000F257159|nr:hypothetical protein [Streptomyces sp. CBMAI 2042]RLV68279.1 ABC transporter transmembrane protein [Streptomyces sp. CBMAI 2042]
MAWAQSVSPARWLTARLAVPAALSVAGVGLLSLLQRWGWTQVREKPSAFGLKWFDEDIFPGIEPVAVGYALFAVAVGALCALLIRRMLLSMAATTVVSPWSWPAPPSAAGCCGRPTASSAAATPATTPG